MNEHDDSSESMLPMTYWTAIRTHINAAYVYIDVHNYVSLIRQHGNPNRMMFNLKKYPWKFDFIKSHIQPIIQL